MRLEQSKLQKVKLVLHAVQAVVIFVAGCITIAVLAKSKKSDGRNAWYLALCFLTIPALIYQVAVPMWSRSQRFAKAYAFAAVDVLYTIFWLSAFAAVAAWNRQGILQGVSDKKLSSDQGNCTTFAYGSESACKNAYATITFGVFVFLLFIAASVISVTYIQKVRKDPAAEDPWLAKGGSGQPYARAGGMERGDGAASKDPIWDPDTQDIDTPFSHEDDRDHDDAGTERGGHQADDEYTLLNSTETDEGRHPGRQVAWGQSPVQIPSVDTEYRGAYGYQAPSALSPTGRPSPASPETLPAYEEFPSRGPGRSGGGYSFSQPGA